MSSSNLNELLENYQGCWKSSSTFWMQANSFPVLAGLVTSEWSNEVKTAVERFCHERNLSELLVRIEKPGQRWTRRRGGYTVTISNVERQVKELSDDGMISLLFEPVSPYCDLYSMALVCDLITRKIDVEIVGPGFDASDILRADVLPHERWELKLNEGEHLTMSSSLFKRTYLTDRRNYQKTVGDRLAKIGARLQNPSFPDDVVKRNVSDLCREHLAHQATKFLVSSGMTTLLESCRDYKPIPQEFLFSFVEEIQRLINRVTSSSVRWSTLSLAASFLSQGRLVIWDFFVPGEADTSGLFLI